MIVPPVEAQTYSNSNNTALPDLINEAAAAAVVHTSNAYATTPVHSVRQTPVETPPTVISNNSFAIELPATPPPPPQSVDLQQQHQQQLLYQQYQQQQQHQQYQQQYPTQPQAAATNDVPLSHLLVSSVYPSLGKMPSASIVHSFAPVYEASAPVQPTADIYQEYVQNPYNPTMQQQDQQQQQQLQQPQQHQQQPPAQQQTTANYFSATVDPSKIPPGSELLYGQQ